MGRQAARLIGAAAIVIAALFALVALSPPEADAAVTKDWHKQPACGDLFLLFARGSGQQGPPKMAERDAFFGGIRSHTPEGLRIAEWNLGLEGGKPSTYNGERYRAVHAAWGIAGTRYGNSVQDGMDELRHVLRDRAQKCTDEVWILGGYSQGAQVVGETLAYLTAKERAKIAFVTLFGDPKFVPNTPGKCTTPAEWVRGTAHCGSGGILTRGVSNPRPNYVPADMTGRIGSWCDQREGVCASGAKHIYDGAHFIYPERMIPEAALEAVYAAHIRGGFTGPIRSLRAARGTTGTDMMIVFDTTGSMWDEIDDMRRNAEQIARKVLSQPLGRVGLVQFRDHDQGDEFTARIETDLTTNFEEFQAGLSRLEAEGGGDTPEAQYTAVMTALKDASWSYTATKSLVVITDAPGKDPESWSGLTRNAVVAEALKSRGRVPDGAWPGPTLAEVKTSHQSLGTVGSGPPVSIFGINVCESCTEATDFMAPLATDTGGSVLTSNSDLTTAFDEVFRRAETRPVVRFPSSHHVDPGAPIIFSAAGSFDPDGTVVGYRWDLDGDGTFEATTVEPHATGTYSTEGQVRVSVGVVSSDGGIGTASTDVYVQRNGLARALPKKVRALKVVRTGAKRVKLTWKAPKGGVKATNYAVYDRSGAIVKVLPAARRSYSIAKVKTGRKVIAQYAVVSANDAGMGPTARTKRVRMIPPKQWAKVKAKERAVAKAKAKAKAKARAKAKRTPAGARR